MHVLLLLATGVTETQRGALVATGFHLKVGFFGKWKGDTRILNRNIIEKEVGEKRRRFEFSVDRFKGFSGKRRVSGRESIAIHS